VTRRITLALFFLTCLMAALNLHASQQNAEGTGDRERDTCAAHAGEPVPEYRIGSQYSKPSPNSIHLFLSMHRGDITRDNLIALVCKLTEENADEEDLYVHVFDSYKIASRFTFIPLGNGEPAGADRSLRAFFIFSRDPGEAYGLTLHWLPKKGQEWEHIYLGPPPPRPPH